MKKFSRDWAYPVTDWKIMFRFKQRERDWCHEFFNVSHLSNYFQSLPEHGMMVGYLKEMPTHRRCQVLVPSSDALLSLWYVEFNREHSYDFVSVYDFANFLKEHSTVAKAVGYK